MRMAFGERRGGLAMAFAALTLLASPDAQAADKIAYAVKVNKVADANLSGAVQASSTLIELEDRPPEDVTALRARAVEDLGRLQKALRSSGYYDGLVFHPTDNDQLLCYSRRHVDEKDDNVILVVVKPF